MSDALSKIIKGLGSDPTKPQSPKNRLGTGYGLHLGFVIQCAGTPDADGNPTDRHKIGMITAVPDEGADVIPVERADEATFELAQSDFVDVCTICGKPPAL